MRKRAPAVQMPAVTGASGGGTAGALPSCRHFGAALLVLVAFIVPCQFHWTSSRFPDLRGPSVDLCVPQVPSNRPLYVCDPDRVLNATQGSACAAYLIAGEFLQFGG